MLIKQTSPSLSVSVAVQLACQSCSWTSCQREHHTAQHQPLHLQEGSLRNKKRRQGSFNLYTVCYMHTLVSQKCWKFTHPQAIQDVNEFVSSLEQIWRNLALHHLLTNRLQWMGAVRMRVQTTDENITIIHNLTPVHQLMSCEVKSYMFKNKQIHH